MKNKTQVIDPKPQKRRTIGCQWIFKLKQGVPKAEAKRFKAKLAAKGLTKREGKNYLKIFSPMVKHTSIRVFLALVTTQSFELYQINVKTTFLYGELEENILMSQLEGYKFKLELFEGQKIDRDVLDSNLESIKNLDLHEQAGQDIYQLTKDRKEKTIRPLTSMAIST